MSLDELLNALVTVSGKSRAVAIDLIKPTLGEPVTLTIEVNSAVRITEAPCFVGFKVWLISNAAKF